LVDSKLLTLPLLYKIRPDVSHVNETLPAGLNIIKIALPVLLLIAGNLKLVLFATVLVPFEPVN
jgi:hypothetical protein